MSENPKKQCGAVKTQYHLIPSTALTGMAKVFKLGADKYGAYNWRNEPVDISTYYSAIMRHLIAYWEGEDIDPESGQPHLWHIACCAAILGDSLERGILKDDRVK